MTICFRQKGCRRSTPFPTCYIHHGSAFIVSKEKKNQKKTDEDVLLFLYFYPVGFIRGPKRRNLLLDS